MHLGYLILELGDLPYKKVNMARQAGKQASKRNPLGQEGGSPPV